MLHLVNLSKSFGLEPLLAEVSFVVNSGERIDCQLCRFRSLKPIQMSPSTCRRW
jgi:hypothetical protein